MNPEMKYSDVGRVLHTLADGAESIDGVSLLNNFLYVLRNKPSKQIEVYDKDSYCLQRCFTVDGLRNSTDIVVCAHYRCCYISDWTGECIHRLALADAGVTQWPVNDKPKCLSVTDRHSVLVTCSEVHRKVKEFTTDGQLIRQLQLPPDVTWPRYTIQLSSGEFIVCHGSCYDQLHRVCLISPDGQVVKSYGGPKGSGSQQMNIPSHLAVDRHGFVFVADRNRRVMLLSPSLTYIRDIVSRGQLQGYPQRLYLHVDESRLFVAVDKGISRGQLVVIRV